MLILNFVGTKQVDLESISSIFYKQLFSTQVLFNSKHFSVNSFCLRHRNIGKKADNKIIVKLTVVVYSFAKNKNKTVKKSCAKHFQTEKTGFKMFVKLTAGVNFPYVL